MFVLLCDWRLCLEGNNDPTTRWPIHECRESYTITNHRLIHTNTRGADCTDEVYLYNQITRDSCRCLYRANRAVKTGEFESTPITCIYINKSESTPQKHNDPAFRRFSSAFLEYFPEVSVWTKFIVGPTPVAVTCLFLLNLEWRSSLCDFIDPEKISSPNERDYHLVMRFLSLFALFATPLLIARPRVLMGV